MTSAGARSDMRPTPPPRGRPRVLAFTCSRERPLLLRNCILQLQAQSYPVDHAVYINGSEDTRALYDDLKRPGLHLSFGPSRTQHLNSVSALAGVELDAYDLFCKVDDDDLYRREYIESVVADFETERWDYSGAHADGMVQGSRWLPDFRLQSLGLLPEDQELGVVEVMPPTCAFSRRAMDHILRVSTTGYEDIEWRRAVALAGLRQHALGQSHFVYHVHGRNLSTWHWLR